MTDYVELDDKNDTDIINIMSQDVVNSINNNFLMFNFGRYNVLPQNINYKVSFKFLHNGKIYNKTITTYKNSYFNIV